MEEPAEEAGLGGEGEFVGGSGAGGGVLVADAGSEGLEEEWGVDHLDGGDFSGVIGEVFCFDSDEG